MLIICIARSRSIYLILPKPYNGFGVFYVIKMTINFIVSNIIALLGLMGAVVFIWSELLDIPKILITSPEGETSSPDTSSPDTPSPDCDEIEGENFNDLFYEPKKDTPPTTEGTGSTSSSQSESSEEDSDCDSDETIKPKKKITNTEEAGSRDNDKFTSVCTLFSPNIYLAFHPWHAYTRLLRFYFLIRRCMLTLGVEKFNSFNFILNPELLLNSIAMLVALLKKNEYTRFNKRYFI